MKTTMDFAKIVLPRRVFINLDRIDFNKYYQVRLNFLRDAPREESSSKLGKSDDGTFIGSGTRS